MCFHFSGQCFKPMPLAGSADPGYPLAGLYFGYDAGSNGLCSRLKAFKISLGPKPENTPAVRTPATLYLNGMIVTVKTGQNKTVPPYPTSVATFAVVWLRPWIIPTHINKLLEIHWKINYHNHTFFETGLAGSGLRAVAFLQAPPSINKKSP